MAMSPRKRAQVSRGVQYAILAVVVVAIAFAADWPTLKDTFISPEITPELFPEILTIALKNTIFYTAGAFVFGLVLGLIGIIYIGAVMAMLGIEINVVLARRLWPRALLTPFTDHVGLTEAARRAYASYARAQRHKGFERVEVTFDERPHRRPPEAVGPDQGAESGSEQGPAQD